jgi:hypothetical protein
MSVSYESCSKLKVENKCIFSQKIHKITLSYEGNANEGS